MCLIVDNNVAADFFTGSNTEFLPLFEAVKGSGCCVVYGGHLKREYFRSPKVRAALRLLDQAGKARVVPDTEVDQATETLIQAGTCLSDDPHVIALAQVTNSRLLCSLDQALHTDFTDGAILHSPRGKVYQNSSHRHLVRQMCISC
jgi:hypothetical protein